MINGAHTSWSGCGVVEAAQGDAIAVNPNEIHDGAPLSACRSWKMIFIEPDMVSRLAGPSVTGSEIGFAARRNPELTRKLKRALGALDSGDAAIAEESLTALLDDLLIRKKNQIGTSDTHPSPGTQRAIERIWDLPESPPSLDEIACLMDLSRCTALRRFRQEVGATPQDYAMQVRLRIARRALLDGNPIAEVAVLTGFADQSHLTRAFARQFGLPPGRWRAAVLGSKIIQDYHN